MSDLIMNFPNLPAVIQEQILDGPAMAPPEGEVSNLVDAPNGNTAGLALAIVCLVLSTSAVLCRVYTRVFLKKSVELQDYLGITAFGLYIVMAWVYLNVLYTGGFFVHQWNVSFRNMISIAKLLTFGLAISYSGALLFAKTAILLEWMRLFSPHRTNVFFFRATLIMIILNALLYISSIISSAISCLPHESLYYPWVKGYCIDRMALAMFTACFNILIDLIILVLPQRIIWRLQMSKSKQIGISLVFSVGVLALVCAIGRVPATWKIEYTGDATFTASANLMWAFAEVTCVLLVFCLPVVPQVFTQKGPLFSVFSYMRSWTRYSSSGSRKTAEATSNNWPRSAEGRYGNQMASSIKDSGEFTSLTEFTLLHSHQGHRGSVQAQPWSEWSPDHRRDTPVSTIRKTTEFHQQQHDEVMRNSDESRVGRQHPWTRT